MTSPFALTAAAAEDQINAVFGETFSFQPRSVPVNGESAADGSRQAVAAFPALFDAGGGPVPAAVPPGFGQATVQRTVAMAQIVFSAAHVAVARAGDRVTRARTSAVYEIRNPRPAGQNRIAAELQLLP